MQNYKEDKVEKLHFNDYVNEYLNHYIESRLKFLTNLVLILKISRSRRFCYWTAQSAKITGNLQRSSLWQGLTILLDFWPDFLLMRPCSALWESQASVYKISFRSCPSLLQLPQTNIASNHLNQSHQRWQAPYFLPKARVFGKEGKWNRTGGQELFIFILRKPVYQLSQKVQRD